MDKEKVVYYSGTWIYYVFYAPYNVTVCANIGRYSRLARNGKYTEDDFNYLIDGLPNDIETELVHVLSIMKTPNGSNFVVMTRKRNMFGHHLSGE